MSKWYGNLSNRIDENKMHCDKIEVGTGMTEYYWSDRRAFEVVKVVNQNNVFVREFDHKAVGEPMSNEWELVSNPNNPIKELKKMDGAWNWVVQTGYGKTYTKANISFGIAEYYYDYEF